MPWPSLLPKLSLMEPPLQVSVAKKVKLPFSLRRSPNQVIWYLTTWSWQPALHILFSSKLQWQVWLRWWRFPSLHLAPTYRMKGIPQVQQVQNTGALVTLTPTCSYVGSFTLGWANEEDWRPLPYSTLTAVAQGVCPWREAIQNTRELWNFPQRKWLN